MTFPLFNADLANRVYDHIVADELSWDQGVWIDFDACGTTYCFAGWALQLTGREWLHTTHPWVADASCMCAYLVVAKEGDYRPKRWADACYSGACRKNRVDDGLLVTYAWDAAAAELGMPDQANQPLFNSSNDLADLRHLIDSHIREMRA